MPERPDGRDAAAALGELRAARRRKRVADIHWIDALYHAYLTGLLGLGATLLLASWIGGDKLGPWRTSLYVRDAPDIVGVGVALAVLVGLRSGARGGPLAIEPADARHVLLAPIDRGLALRGPALKQLRFATFVAVIVGAIAGQLATHRLSGNHAAWLGSGAVLAVVTMLLGYGSALIAGSRRLPTWLANVLGLALVGWAVADAADVIHASPTGLVGTIATWPLEFEPRALIAAGVAVVLVLVGLAGLRTMSLEGAERRTQLVGQLKFAATLQDLRTVMVLRRQLAMELPRTRPWLRQRSPGRLPVWHRGIRGALRWPVARVARLVGLGAVAGICLRGVGDGTLPLVLLAGIALYVAGLDAVESMAQEADHPGRSEALPRPIGDLLVRHLGVGVVVMVLVCLVGAGVALALDPSLSALAMAGIAVPPAALAAAAGAALSVLQGIQEPSATWDLAPPEVAGMRTVFRVIGPPLVATAGCLPIVIARVVVDADGDGDPFAAAALGAVIALVVAGLAVGWIHQREEIKAWFRRVQEEAGMGGTRPSTAGATTGGGTRATPRPTGRKPAPTKVTTSLPRKRS
ncbi:MAG TPA: hypothetical protein VD926_11575 [Acidimicrobiales bacterium]|nr:hypothetical protein [Acidimicrobiales bacterium]